MNKIYKLLNDSSSEAKNTYYFAYLKSRGIKFFKPSINNTNLDYFIDNNKLFMPLWIIKNIK